MSSKPTEMLFREIETFITDSSALLDAGDYLELSGLDSQVRTLCEAVLQLSQEERIAYADRLQQLLADLKILGDRMVHQRDQLAEEIRGLSQHKKASKAYKIVDASDDYGSRDDDSD
jgi:hypothetical protein